MRRFVFSVFTAFFSLALTLAGAEVFTRVFVEPYPTPNQPKSFVEPGGKLFTLDPHLGYRHLPGRFVVSRSGAPDFVITNDANTLRISHPIEQKRVTQSEGWFFGCSYTYGWAVSDQDTFVWKLQEQSDETTFRNFGVNGYGTLHSYIQFKDELSKGFRPKFAAIVYASFHDERNTFLRVRRKAVAAWNRLGPLNQPHAWLENGQLKIAMSRVEYEPWPLQDKSALIRYLEDTYDYRIEDRLVKSRDVTRAIVQEFIALTRANDIPVLLFGLTDDARTKDMLAFANASGAFVADISTDYSLPSALVVGDGHPSPSTHTHYAKRIRQVLLDRKLW